MDKHDDVFKTADLTLHLVILTFSTIKKQHIIHNHHNKGIDSA